MTSLRAVLAFNMKEQRHKLDLSQARLAEKVNTSTQYIAMIETKKKFPTPEMLERIAAALDIDAPALFSTVSYPEKGADEAQSLQELVLSDIAQVLSLRLQGVTAPKKPKTRKLKQHGGV